MTERRWKNRPDPIHPGDRAVFWLAVVGFIVLFVLGLLK
jgi:hypothetical protein